MDAFGLDHGRKRLSQAHPTGAPDGTGAEAPHQNPWRGKSLRPAVLRLLSDAAATGDKPPRLNLTLPKQRATNPTKVRMTLNIGRTDWLGRAGLERNLSRVSGNYHARFL